MSTRYPDVTVQLTGRDGNAGAILGACQTAAREAGLDKATIDEFTTQAMAGDYDSLLATCMEWFDIH